MTRADLDKDPQAVAAMFDDVARRYDLTNDVLSLGRTAAWRRAVTAALEPLAGTTVLDLAAGTGTSSTPLIDQDAVVVSCDFSLGMLRQGQVQYPTQLFVAGDALALPFADDTFDAVTTSLIIKRVCARWLVSPGPAVDSWSASSPPRRGRPWRRPTRST